jgi:hypothetical protein
MRHNPLVHTGGFYFWRVPFKQKNPSITVLIIHLPKKYLTNELLFLIIQTFAVTFAGTIVNRTVRFRHATIIGIVDKLEIQPSTVFLLKSSLYRVFPPVIIDGGQVTVFS